MKRIDIDVPKLITACCALHNVCEVNGDSFDEDWLEGVEITRETEANDGTTQSESGDSIRRALMSYFQHNADV
jgi:hypothetical protein